MSQSVSLARSPYIHQNFLLVQFETEKVRCSSDALLSASFSSFHPSACSLLASRLVLRHPAPEASEATPTIHLHSAGQA